MTDKPKSIAPTTAPGKTPARSAVALFYDRKTTPRVTAKGSGHVAEEILALAREHNIPVYEDAALAALLARIGRPHRPTGNLLPCGMRSPGPPRARSAPRPGR